MRFIYCQWTYSDSSRIFGNGICCEKISSSNESLPVEVAIKCASFQHCTVSELPCFSAIARFCSHISTDYGKIGRISLILITNKNPFVIFQKFSYQSNYPNRWCNFQPVSYWFPALLWHHTHELLLFVVLLEHSGAWISRRKLVKGEALLILKNKNKNIRNRIISAD